MHKYPGRGHLTTLWRLDLYKDSKGQTNIARLARQVPLSDEPSHQLFYVRFLR